MVEKVDSAALRLTWEAKLETENVSDGGLLELLHHCRCSSAASGPRWQTLTLIAVASVGKSVTSNVHLVLHRDSPWVLTEHFKHAHPTTSA